MTQRETEDDLVLIDERGVARPIGVTARETMAWFADATLEMLPSPKHALLFLRENAHSGGFWLSGEIGHASRLHDVCGMIAQSGWRGELIICSEGVTRTIATSEGNVIGAWSTDPAERLGPVLCHFGEMSDEQIEETSRAMGRGVRFGDAAVRLGFITRETLFRYLHKQTELIVYTAVAVDDGTFSFREVFDESGLTFPLSMPLNGMLMEGVRRMDEMGVFRERVPSDKHVASRIAGNSVPPEHPCYVLFGAVNDQRDVAELAAACGKDTFQITRELYELVRKGHVSLSAPRQTGILGVVAIFNEVISLILGAIDEYPGASQDIRESLASFASSGVVYAPIFRGAGPALDGTLDAVVVRANIANMDHLEDGERNLAEWLYEYASFAMFISEPVLRAGANSDAAAISAEVAGLLAPLAPDM